MATIQSITLTITPLPNSTDVSVYVGYEVSASGYDLLTEQHYREMCELIGDDTPGDGTDDVLRTIFEATTVFDATHAQYTRAIQLFLPLSALDEDGGGPLLQEDEIRARVTMLPIPTSRESNLVRVGGWVLEPG